MAEGEEGASSTGILSGWMPFYTETVSSVLHFSCVYHGLQLAGFDGLKRLIFYQFLSSIPSACAFNLAAIVSVSEYSCIVRNVFEIKAEAETKGVITWN